MLNFGAPNLGSGARHAGHPLELLLLTQSKKVSLILSKSNIGNPADYERI